MTKVPLRTYLREIESAIEEGQTDEAVAHCRHILKTFPKHIETYRHLGKAYLEAQRYGSAADIFQRVLSALPDDFVSHVGMSIIREDEGNLDTALWHMERAFEVQPYNPAIQGEVRRLYGKRDGMEPAKARLTRGALARTYAKGGHHEQAIAELRAALADEPDRSDLHVILAEMYAQSGENLKAIETCSTILKDLPYCLQANRLLGRLLQGTDREDESKGYLQRAHALEPYDAHISSHAPTAEDVPDQAVTIERLGWDAAVSGDPDANAQPEWASSLGVELEQPESPRGEIPDWLAAASEDSPAPDGDEDVTPRLEDDEIPEWMQDAGWESASGEADEEPSTFSLGDDTDEEQEDAVAADLPDWIKDMAPAAAAAAVASQASDEADDNQTVIDQPEKSTDEGAPDWMQDLQMDSSPEMETTSSSQEQDLPDWIQDEAGDVAEPADETMQLPQEEMPDWVEDSAPEAGEPKPTMAAGTTDDMPDWLKGIDGGPDEDEAEDAISTGVTDFLMGLRKESEEDIEQPAAQAEETGEAEEPDDLPDWLASAEPAETVEPAAQAPVEAAPEDDFAWLKEEEKIQPVADTAGETQSEGPAEDETPDWLKAAATPDETPTEIAETEAPQEEISPQPAVAETEPEPIPDWLDDLASATLAEEADESAPEEQQPATATPDWLSEISEETPEPEAEPEFKPTPESMRTAAANALDAEDDLKMPSFEDMDPQAERTQELPEWLSTSDGTDAETDLEPTPVEEPVAEEATVDDAFPEWLAPPSEDKTAVTKAAPDTEFEDTDDAMAWLEGLSSELETVDEGQVSEPQSETAPADQAETPEPVTASRVDDGTPEWLKDIGKVDTDQDEEPTSDEIDPATEPAEPESDAEFEDADAAMAWLEGLAAKQGVSEDELISSPEERPDTLPDWVMDTTESETVATPVEEQPAPNGSEPEPSQAETEPVMDDVEPTLGDTEPTMVESEGALGETEPPRGDVAPEDLPDWLQDSAFAPADADAVPEDAGSIQPSEALEEPVAEDVDEAAKWIESDEEAESSAEEETPDWLLAAIEGETIADVETSTVEVGESDQTEDLPDWLKDTPATAAPLDIPSESEEDAAPAVPEVEPTQEVPDPGAADPGAAEASEALPEWLKDVSPEPEEETQAEDATWIREFGKEVPQFEIVDSETPTDEEAGPEPEEAPAQPLPGWLQDIEEGEDQPETAPAEPIPDEEYTWRPSETVQPPVASEEKLDLNQASLVELERLPGMGFRKAQAVFSHREEHGPFNKLDDLLILGIEPETIAGIKDLVEVKPALKVDEPATLEVAPIQPVEAVPTPVELPSVPPGDAEDEHHAAQIEAQGKLAQGDISGAMDDYDQLIKKGKRIEEVITDLESAAQIKSDNPEILQALGDAYTRADRLQEALDTYTKVEQLLQ